MENKKLIYKVEHERLTIECFKLLDVDEFTEDGYEIMATNPETKHQTSLTTNTPQGAVALADLTVSEL